MRITSGVKSLSLVTRAKPSTRWLYRRSIASMIMAASVAFLPEVYWNCWMGTIACGCSFSSHPRKFWFFQLPYARRMVITPNFASSLRIPSIAAALALSQSMRSARRFSASMGHSLSSC